MTWRSTALILAAFVGAGFAVWFGPDLLAPLGLGEFGLVGQFGFTVLILSVLDAAFTRPRRSSADHEIGPTERPPPDP